jgi:hypothetical protein
LCIFSYMFISAFSAKKTEPPIFSSVILIAKFLSRSVRTSISANAIYPPPWIIYARLSN